MQDKVLALKEKVKALGITYGELATLSNVPIGTIKSIFSGRTPFPRIDTIQAIEKALGIDEKPTLAQQVLDTTLANLDIADYENLTPAEQKQVADIFNKVVQAFKQK